MVLYIVRPSSLQYVIVGELHVAGVLLFLALLFSLYIRPIKRKAYREFVMVSIP